MSKQIVSESETIVSEFSPASADAAQSVKTSAEKINLLDLNRQQMRDLFVSMGRSRSVPIRS